MKEAQDLSSSYIANCVFNAFLSYTAVMLNCVTIHAIRKTSLLPKPLKTLLLSLAVSDLGVGLIVQPLYIACLVMELQQNSGNNQTFNATSNAYGITGFVFTFASFFGVVALSADSSSSQIPGTCDSQACCCCGNFNLGVECNYQFNV